MVKASLNNRRFRAAYDFLLLRTMVHEVDEEIAQWWTEIQEQEPQGRDQMISELNKTYKQGRQPKSDQDSETDGNSINYNSIEYQNGVGDNFGNTTGNNSANNNRSRHRKPQHSRKKKPTHGKRRGGRGKNPNANGHANAQGNAEPGNGNSVHNADPNQRGPKARRGKKRSSKRGGPARGAGGRGRSNRGRNAANSDGRYQDARPKDDYGNHSSNDENQKKVKVRRKKRVLDGPEDKPVF